MCDAPLLAPVAGLAGANFNELINHLNRQTFDDADAATAVARVSVRLHWLHLKQAGSCAPTDHSLPGLPLCLVFIYWHSEHRALII